MRLGDYGRMTVRDLLSRPLRSFLTIVALTISAGVLALLGAMALGGQRALMAQLGTANDLTNITVTPNQNSGGLAIYSGAEKAGGSHGMLHDADITALASDTRVKGAYPRVQVWELANAMINEVNFVAKAQGILQREPLPLIAGSDFASDDQQNAVIVGYDYAKSLGYEKHPGDLVGKTVTLTTQKGYRGIGATIPPPGSSQQTNDAFSQQVVTLQATVIGVTQPGPVQGQLFLPFNWARAIRTVHYYDNAGSLQTTDQVAKDGYSTIVVQANTVDAVSDIERSIRALGYSESSLLQYVNSFQQVSGVAGIILGMVAIVALVASVLGVANTMLMSIAEQQYEIGIWRACGAKRAVIVCLFLCEAAILGIIGGGIGAAVAIPLGAVINTYASSLLVQQGLQSIAIVELTPTLMAIVVVLSVTFSLVAGLYPAYKAARADPSKILRAH